MDICVDSNILIYSLNESSPFHVNTSDAILKLNSNGDEIIVFPQNLIEFWAVATRPISSNGLGFTTTRAAEELAQIRSVFHLVTETPAIFPEWQRLVAANTVSGKSVHDTRIVAQMNVNNIDNILTLNAKDFSRYSNINALEPGSVLTKDV